MVYRIQHRHDTAAHWTAADPTLLIGEWGYESDTKKYKVGDGATKWSLLAYTPTAGGTVNTDLTGTTTTEDVSISGALNVGGTTTPLGYPITDGELNVVNQAQFGSGFISQASTWGSSIMTLPSTGLPAYQVGTCAYDLTDGTYDSLLTTVGITFTSASVGHTIILISGAHAGGVARIAQYVDANNVVLETAGWDADVVAGTGVVYIQDGLSFTSPAIKINKVGADCHWINEARNHTGDYPNQFTATAGASGPTTVRITADTGVYSNVDALQIREVVGNLPANSVANAIRVVIDDSLCGGGSSVDIDAIMFSRTKGGSTATMDAVHVGTGFSNALVVEGVTGIYPTKGYTFTAAYAATDVTSNFGGGVPVQVFTAQNTGILVGSSAQFGVIEFNSSIVASTSITPTFQYSTGDGVWTTLTVSDTTLGFTKSGKVSFAIPTSPAWVASAHVNGATGAVTSEYYVRIIRTKKDVPTPPTVSSVYTFATAAATTMSVRGDGTIHPTQMADSAAPNDSLYFSTTGNALAYKTGAGVVKLLYTP